MVRHWGPESASQFNCLGGIFQASDNYLWVGSYSGLWRFDGVNFSSVGAYWRQELIGSSLDRFFEDSQKRKWMRFSMLPGIYLYPPDQDTLIHFILGDKKQYITGVAERQGQVIVTTRERVYCLKGDQFVETARFDSAGPKINRLKVIGQLVCLLTTQGVYAVTSKGLLKLSRYGHANVEDICPLKKPNEELLIENHQLYRCKGNSRQLVYQIPPEEYENLTVDKAGTAWLLTFSGLKRIDDRGVLRVDNQTIPNGSDVGSIFCDKDGSLWLGHMSHGLSRVHPKVIHSFSVEEKAHGSSVGPVMPWENGSLMVSTYCGGLNLFSKGQLRPLPITWDNSVGCVWTLLRTRNGDFWYGNWAGGVHHLHDGFHTTYTGHLALSNIVFALYEDRRGIIWAGTKNGLMHQQGRTFVPAHAALLGYEVRVIKEDHEGRLICGTSDGVYIFTNGKLARRYSTREGLSHNRVRDVLEDKYGNYWVATYGGGLQVIIRGRAFAFNSPILDPFCSGLAMYNDKLFISSNKGIFYAPVQNLLDFAEGKTDMALFRCLNQQHGMSIDECNGGGQPAVARLGPYLYFPTVDGLAQVNAQSLVDDPEPSSNLIIEQVNIEGRLVKPVNGVYQLPANTARVEVIYNCPELSNPQDVYFQNKLLGEDRNWSTPTHQRKVDFILPPGDHELAIRLYGPRNGKAITEARLRLRIPLPVYKKTWFTYLVSLLVLVLLSFAFWIRVRVIRRKEAHKTMVNKRYAEIEMKAFRNQMNPHFIFNSMNNIKFFITVGDSHTAAKYVDSFGRVLRHFTEYSLSNTIPLAAELTLLKDYIKLEQMRFDHSFSFEMVLPANNVIPVLNVPTMMLQPLLENAIRHGFKPATGPCHLVLEIRVQGDRLLLRVIDNGVGIDPRLIEPKTDHNSVAMANIRVRINTLNYLFNSDITMQYINRTVEEHGSTGTIVELNLPTDL